MNIDDSTKSPAANEVACWVFIGKRDIKKERDVGTAGGVELIASEKVVSRGG